MAADSSSELEYARTRGKPIDRGNTTNYEVRLPHGRLLYNSSSGIWEVYCTSKQSGNKRSRCLEQGISNHTQALIVYWRWEVGRNKHSRDPVHQQQQRHAQQQLSQLLNEQRNTRDPTFKQPHLGTFQAKKTQHLQRKQAQQAQQTHDSCAEQVQEQLQANQQGQGVQQQETWEHEQPHVTQQQQQNAGGPTGGTTTAPGHPQADSSSAGQPGTISQVHSPSIPASDGQQQGLQDKDKGAHGVTCVGRALSPAHTAHSLLAP